MNLGSHDMIATFRRALDHMIDSAMEKQEIVQSMTVNKASNMWSCELSDKERSEKLEESLAMALSTILDIEGCDSVLE